MSNTTLNTKSLFGLLRYTNSELIELISSFDAVKINAIPFRNSWTAAQVTDHVTKSNKAITQAMAMEVKKTPRNPGERIEELKNMLLNYQTKFQAPDFIMPAQQIYAKENLITELQTSIGRLKTSARESDLREIISLPSFGAITKFELTWFVLYHTQRHIHQLKKIFISLM